ncbi:MarR family transcriptional regulator [Carboxylicivirga linearis]|uniref:MarR family transcriptional regulator n=1 Tax=Carboxylicivirga linearis TaxID=1628157 RepID=A0ABS5K204_9BACT|nr:MarR family transcriptional regulator [Carboxylicivirga linearis]MBS2100556.1 MarR family transcriptional regulator [Carboxylicivirga linearis]
MEIHPLGMIIGSMRGIFPRLMIARMNELGFHYTFDQWVVLMVLAFKKKQDMVQQDIAEFMNKDKSLVLRIVDVLEKDALIARTTDLNDRRRNIINLTTKGRDLTNLFYKEEQLISEKLLEGLTEEEVNSFYKVISHVKSRAQEL